MARACLQRLLKLVRLGKKLGRDTDFLGYEAFCSLNLVITGRLSPGRAAEKADKAGFVAADNKAFSRKAA
jgi:hypothetical protein